MFTNALRLLAPLPNDSPPPPTTEKLPPMCVICCEPAQSHRKLLRPCRGCDAIYCATCLSDMFLSATRDPTRMPPRCCTLIQIHAVVPHLDARELDAYRSKFEEWLSPTKIYCPSPTCSAFIPARKIPDVDSVKLNQPSRSTVFSEILDNVRKVPAARFFRSEMDITQLPGHNGVIAKPMDLGIIRTKINRGKYSTAGQVTEDMGLIVHNSHTYNGPDHPVSKAAGDLFVNYVRELGIANDRLIDMETPKSPPTVFPCPSCHLALCTNCKQIEHGEAPCDTKITDYETNFLTAFGYKRCPRCSTGVKKMFGCSHMHCICGAHWCWGCQRSIQDCPGSCDEADEEEEYYSSSDDYEDEDEVTAGVTPARIVQNRAGTHLNTTSAPPGPDPSNLDAAPPRYWTDHTDLDFGDEPEEPTKFRQIWACTHTFKPFDPYPPTSFPHHDNADGAEPELSRGDLTRMECNRCFRRVEARKWEDHLSSNKGGVGRDTGGVQRKRGDGKVKASLSRYPPALEARVERRRDEGPDLALECVRCGVLVCRGCLDDYGKVAGGKREGGRGMG